jgi:hypothetical protein
MTGGIIAEWIDANGNVIPGSINTYFYCSADGLEPAALEAGVGWKYVI